MTKRPTQWLIVLAAMIATTGSGMAGETEQRLIREIYTGDRIASEQFSASFLNAVPINQMRAVSETLRASYGGIVSLTGDDGSYRIETGTHAIPVKIVLDEAGAITGLLFEPPVTLTATLEETLDEIEALPGKIAYLATMDGETIAGRDADQALAVGSAFKLGVLAALKRQIEAGQRAWDEVVRLEQADISLGGMLAGMPAGAPLTIHSVAALMIAQSDNTATDVMMRAVGRDAVGEALDIDMPLTTREFFTLKSDAALRERYLSDPAATLGEVAGMALPHADKIGQHNEGVEWYMPAQRLCALLEEVADLDVTGINPGVARPDDWRNVAYKGGSEIGVLNLSTMTTTRDGRTICAVLTVNAPDAIAEDDVFSLYGRMLQQLAVSQ